MHLWRRKKSELMNLLRVMIWCKLKKKVKKGRVQKRVSSTEGNPSKYKFPYNELVVWSEWMSCHAFVGENDFFIRSFVKIFSLDFSSQVPLLITPAVSKIKKKKILLSQNRTAASHKYYCFNVIEFTSVDNVYTSILGKIRLNLIRRI